MKLLAQAIQAQVQASRSARGAWIETILLVGMDKISRVALRPGRVD